MLMLFDSSLFGACNAFCTFLEIVTRARGKSLLMIIRSWSTRISAGGSSGTSSGRWNEILASFGYIRLYDLLRATKMENEQCAELSTAFLFNYIILFRQILVCTLHALTKITYEGRLQMCHHPLSQIIRDRISAEEVSDCISTYGAPVQKFLLRGTCAGIIGYKGSRGLRSSAGSWLNISSDPRILHKQWCFGAVPGTWKHNYASEDSAPFFLFYMRARSIADDIDSRSIDGDVQDGDACGPLNIVKIEKKKRGSY